jgi:hypothetical protein
MAKAQRNAKLGERLRVESIGPQFHRLAAQASFRNASGEILHLCVTAQSIEELADAVREGMIQLAGRQGMGEEGQKEELQEEFAAFAHRCLIDDAVPRLLSKEQLIEILAKELQNATPDSARQAVSDFYRVDGNQNWKEEVLRARALMQCIYRERDKAKYVVKISMLRAALDDAQRTIRGQGH